MIKLVGRQMHTLKQTASFILADADSYYKGLHSGNKESIDQMGTFA